MSMEVFEKTCSDIELLNELLGSSYHIFLTGGEPFLHKDIKTFVRLAKSNARCDSVTVFTNGTCSNQLARELIDEGVDYFQVSIEGSEQYHDALRGKGNWKKSINFIQRVIDYRAASVGVATTVTKKNIHAAEKIYDLCNSLSVQSLVFHRFIPCGGLYDEDLVLSFNDNMFFYKTLMRLKNKLRYTELNLDNCSIASFQSMSKLRVDKADKISGGCHIGVSCLHIEPNGDLITCPKASIVIGNIMSQSLHELFFLSNVLKKFRKRDFGIICGKCIYNKTCGGCRAVAMHYGGDIWGDEILCPFFLTHNEGHSRNVS